VLVTFSATSSSAELRKMPCRCSTWPSFIALSAAAVFFMAVVFSSHASYSGELDSERDEDYGLAFVGSARETGTLAPMPDVLVKAEMGNHQLLVRTNREGVYKMIVDFGNNVTADQIVISCVKDGYEMVDVSRRKQSSASARELVVAECLLAPKP
jgi:hypothetical protein